jgi:hypothetical protein
MPNKVSTPHKEPWITGTLSGEPPGLAIFSANEGDPPTRALVARVEGDQEYAARIVACVNSNTGVPWVPTDAAWLMRECRIVMALLANYARHAPSPVGKLDATRADDLIGVIDLLLDPVVDEEEENDDHE